VGEESLFLYPSEEPIRLEIKALDRVVLNFRARPDGGIVEVRTAEEKAQVDLYEEFPEEKPLILQFSAPLGVRLISPFIFGYVTGYILFFLPALWLSPSVSRYRREEEDSGRVSVRHVLVNLALPLGILAVVCASLAWVNACFFTMGVAYHFLLEVWLIGSVLIAGRYLLAVESGRIRQGEWGQAHNPAEKMDVGHLLLLLLPLTPVAQYIISNRESLSAADIAIITVFFVAFTGLYVFAIPLLFGRLIPARKLLIFGLALMFTLMNMASLSGTFAWFERGDLRVQLIYLAFVAGMVWLLVEKVDRRLGAALVVIFLLTNSGFQWMSRENELQRLVGVAKQHRLELMAGEKEPNSTPNIYLLVYDAYVANETMLAHDIDNGPQESYLREKGFTLYPRAYSIGATTVTTMSNVLDITADFEGARNPRSGVSGNGYVQQTLRSLGYRTYGVFDSDYMFRGIGSSYDISFPEKIRPQYLYMIGSILMGEFRFDLDFADQTWEEYTTAKNRVLESIPRQPVFLYAHSVMPGHSQNSGACLPNEVQLYRERLQKANREMRQDVETIITNDPGAVIIIAGDHGPYLTKNCAGTASKYEISEIDRLDIQDRFGTFLAIRWPSDDYVDFDQITVLQDVFSAVFAYLYQDTDFLELKIEPFIFRSAVHISGASVNDGIIQGGVHDGEALFLSGE
jgi:hypothetical protein